MQIMNTKFLKWKTLFAVFVLMLVSIHPGLVHAQSGCDPATGQQCDSTPAPTCGLPGQPPCGNGSDSKPNPKPTKTLPPPVITRTFTPTATATLTNTPEPSSTATSTIEYATLPPRPTEPSLTPTEVGVNPFARQAATPFPYAWQVFPNGFGGSSSGTYLLFGITSALIIIGILWSIRARSFADGSVRENPLINEQLQDSTGSRNFAKMESPGSENFMKEVFDDDNSFGDSL